MKKVIIPALLLIPLFTQAFSAQVFVDTGTENINALEAAIHVPNRINIDKIYDGNSAIIFWINPPTFDSQSHTIYFSGITPGGFSGKKMILSFSGELSKEDLPNFTFSEARALRNDESNGSVPINLTMEPATDLVADTIYPEPFDPMISVSPDIFGNRHFIIFATQDKGTGIDHYEFASTWFLQPSDKEWKTVESPYSLSRIENFKKIYIRAIDKSHNYITMSISGSYRYLFILTSVIILLCVFLSIKRLVSLRYP